MSSDSWRTVDEPAATAAGSTSVTRSTASAVLVSFTGGTFSIGSRFLTASGAFTSGFSARFSLKTAEFVESFSVCILMMLRGGAAGMASAAAAAATVVTVTAAAALSLFEMMCNVVSGSFSTGFSSMTTVVSLMGTISSSALSCTLSSFASSLTVSFLTNVMAGRFSSASALSLATSGLSTMSIDSVDFTERTR
uniref:(northern house mosquito) hypothetical protein n=1 Tax=Culex pipiens TaxID=7175 RepID=A0A8D8FMR0_CULPI